jgi:hypothetical protein
MEIGQAVVEIAVSEIGTCEVPLGSNRGPDVQRYQQATSLGGTGWPWCVAFAQWCWRKAGHPLPYGGAGAFNLLDWAHQHPGWASTRPAVGDIAIFNIGSGHGAVVERWDEHYIHTVDGNWGDRVSRVAHPRSSVRGFVHPPHPLEAARPAPKVEPRWEVVTSASGHTKIVLAQRRKGALARALRLLRHGSNSVTIRRHRR